MAFDPSVDSGPTQPTTTAPTSGGGNADWLKMLAQALAAVGGGVAGRAIANQSGNPLTQAVPPQLSQLLDNAVARQGYQNPLYQATTKGVYDMLPTFAKEGTSLSGNLPSTIPQSASASASGGGPGLGTAVGAGALGALAAALGKAGSGSGGDISKLVKDIIDHFKKQRQIQGNKPYQGGALPSGNPGMNGFTGWDNSWDVGMNYDQWPGGGGPTPNVTTDMNFSYPGDVFGTGWSGDPNNGVDANWLNGGWTGPSDPSGGSGVGPGMQPYYSDEE